MNEQLSNGKDGQRSGTFRERLGIKSLMGMFTNRKTLPFVYLTLFTILSLVLFPPTKKAKEIIFKEGDVADSDVIAPFTFIVPQGEQEIRINRAKAAVAVPPVYRRNDEAALLLPNDLKVLMGKIEAIAESDTLTVEERVQRIREAAPAIENDPVRLLLQGNVRNRMLEEGLDLQRRLLDTGIINDASPLQRRDYPHITVISNSGEELVSSAPLIEQGQLNTVILDEANKAFKRSGDSVKLFYSIVRSHVEPNLVFDMAETKKRRDEKMREVPEAFEVTENQRIVSKHDKVTAVQVKILETLEKRRMERELATSYLKKLSLLFSKALRIVILVLIFGFALFRFRRDLLFEPDKLNLVFITLVFYLLLAALVIRLPSLSPYLIPVAFVSLISTAFFGVMSSVIFTVFASLLLVTHTDLPASFIFISILAGTAAIVSIANLRERRNFYRIFLYISAAYVVGIIGFGVTEGISAGTFFYDSLWGITNGFACTVLVMFLLPILESLFDVTTNFTLMELSDLNRPLLKRLIMKAPGTYHHSLMVANLVEAVADDVGANGLYARVGAYYHDIGKLSKPEYFFENKGDNINKHDKLSPSMSALILASHVKDGVELAKNEKLPRIIIDAISEHHGTTIMAYFYRKALEYDSHDSVNVDDFRYPGPRPRTKETALIMLADSAEAAVRSLKEPTSPRIKTIVGKIIETRMNDGELDQSGLTLNDIAAIREKYTQLLTGIFHPRINYPEQEGEEGSEGKGRPARENNPNEPSTRSREKRV